MQGCCTKSFTDPSLWLELKAFFYSYSLSFQLYTMPRKPEVKSGKNRQLLFILKDIYKKDHQIRWTGMHQDFCGSTLVTGILVGIYINVCIYMNLSICRCCKPSSFSLKIHSIFSWFQCCWGRSLYEPSSISCASFFLHSSQHSCLYDIS